MVEESMSKRSVMSRTLWNMNSFPRIAHQPPLRPPLPNLYLRITHPRQRRVTPNRRTLLQRTYSRHQSHTSARHSRTRSHISQRIRRPTCALSPPTNGGARSKEVLPWVIKNLGDARSSATNARRTTSFAMTDRTRGRVHLNQRRIGLTKRH